MAGNKSKNTTSDKLAGFENFKFDDNAECGKNGSGVNGAQTGEGRNPTERGVGIFKDKHTPPSNGMNFNPTDLGVRDPSIPMDPGQEDWL